MLDKVLQLEQEADAFGFRWGNSEQIMQQIESECLEIREHLTTPLTKDVSPQLQEEIGDLLHAAFSLCVFCGFNPEETLEKTVSKFERRLTAVKQLAQTEGLSELHGHSFDALMVLWKKAKHLVG